MRGALGLETRAAPTPPPVGARSPAVLLRTVTDGVVLTVGSLVGIVEATLADSPDPPDPLAPARVHAGAAVVPLYDPDRIEKTGRVELRAQASAARP
jgi:hypothetical protein